MDSGSGESSSGDPQISSVGGSSGTRNAGSFDCNICFDPAQEPVVTLCGHLFCWPCLYEWLHGHSRSSECPVCKSAVEEEEIVPLYGGGNSSTVTQSRSVSGMDIPERPSGRRPATAPQPPQPGPYHAHHHIMNHVHQHNPWFMGSNQFAGMPPGNFTFPNAVPNQFAAAANQMAGMRPGNFAFLDATANNIAASFRRGYTNIFPNLHAHGFPHGHGQHAYMFHHGHGHHAHGFGHARGFWRPVNRGQQVDVFWNAFLFLFVALVIANIILQMPL